MAFIRNLLVFIVLQFVCVNFISASSNALFYKKEKIINVEKFNISRVQKKEAVLRGLLVHGWNIESHSISQVIVTSHSMKSLKETKIRIDIKKDVINVIIKRKKQRKTEAWLNNILREIDSNLRIFHYMNESRQYEKAHEDL